MMFFFPRRRSSFCVVIKRNPKGRIYNNNKITIKERLFTVVTIVKSEKEHDAEQKHWFWFVIRAFLALRLALQLVLDLAVAGREPPGIFANNNQTDRLSVDGDRQ